ncbi:MAG TPA: carbonic anhydrase [Woeseiaceae bacterium]
MISAVEALQRLLDGNARFISGVRSLDAMVSHTRLDEFTAGQQPFAVILGCSDSRVPVEIVFDQGMGDLFVIRVAGNVVAPSQIGSVEFAAERFSTKLVVVLGHSRCGAVQATLEQLRGPAERQSPNLTSIVSRIEPSVAAVLENAGESDESELERLAVRANVRASVEALKHGSDILENLVARDELLIVGAEYSLDTGVVDFFADQP